jgi:hypothetical protein
MSLFRRQPNNLTAHLPAGGTRLTAQFHGIQFVICLQRNIEDTGNEGIMCQTNRNCFPLPYSSRE